MLFWEKWALFNRAAGFSELTVEGQSLISPETEKYFPENRFGLEESGGARQLPVLFFVFLIQTGSRAVREERIPSIARWNWVRKPGSFESLPEARIPGVGVPGRPEPGSSERRLLAFLRAAEGGRSRGHHWALVNSQ